MDQETLGRTARASPCRPLRLYRAAVLSPLARSTSAGYGDGSEIVQNVLASVIRIMI